MTRNFYKRALIIFLAAGLFSNSSAFAIEDTSKKFSLFKREKNEVKLEKSKREKITEIELPSIIPFQKSVTVNECIGRCFLGGETAEA